ncbi:MAG TPA: transcription termination factor Rho [Phycisphaerales bacterium]|nr:transcription termination factor Rho [Phycisphaerales bacterium]
MAKTTKKKKVTKKAAAKKAAAVTEELFNDTSAQEASKSDDAPAKTTKVKAPKAEKTKAKAAQKAQEPQVEQPSEEPKQEAQAPEPKPQPQVEQPKKEAASDSGEQRQQQPRQDNDNRNRHSQQNQNKFNNNRTYRSRRGGKFNGRNDRGGNGGNGGGGNYNQQGGGNGGGSYSGGQHRDRPDQSDAQLDAETQARYEQAKQSDVSIRDLQKMEIDELVELAKAEQVENYAGLKKQELIFHILKARIKNQGLMYGEGVLEILPGGFGFLRSPEYSYLACPDDIYVSPSQIRRFGLKPGHIVQGTIRPPKESEKYFALLRVDAVNGQPPDHLNDIRNFEDLTPLHPYQRFILEQGDGSKRDLSMRVVDLVTPIGRGQRGLIVAPPRTGKTVMMQSLANSVITNFPDCKVIVLLIDERPEEVTDFRQNTPAAVEIIASTFDEQTSRHVQVCEMVIEKARRMVEFGEHVVILMDSLTRMARAYNQEMPHSGKILTGGLDANALQRPRKFLGSARAIENGGSLTIIATALVDTGSKMDDIIFEEFKGTGNMELHLDRRLVEKRTYPAIDVAASGTRREELLMDPRELELTYRLRKVLADMNVVEAMELLKNRLERVKTNAEFLLTMNLD